MRFEECQDCPIDLSGIRFVYRMPSARDHEAGRIRDPTDQVVLSC